MTGVRICASTVTMRQDVRQFNARLAAGGVSYRLPEPEEAPAGARDDGAPQLEHYVAVDPTGAVRGGYSLQYQQFMVAGAAQRVAFYKLPLSEGLVDPRFAMVGVTLVRHTLKQEPHLFVLGIGGRDEALARLLTSWRWPLREVPFYFRLIRASRALRMLATRHAGRVGTCLRAAHRTGVGPLIGGLASGWARLHTPRGVSVSPIDAFGEWADAIWEANRRDASFIARRDRVALDGWYGRQPRLLRYLVTRRGSPIGWAVALDTPMNDHRDFGDLRVGTIVDGLALPGHEGTVAVAVTDELAARGVDLVLSNQARRRWQRACVQAGFLPGPSRFLFGAAPKLRETIGADAGAMHLTRGDGDGPMHL